MPFRLQCRVAFLTYAQADAIDDKQALFDFLVGIERVIAVLVAREAHSDGGTHYHCVIEFNKRVDIRGERFFDFEGCHPNVQSVRCKRKTLEYCIKDGDYINFGFDLSKLYSITEIVKQAAEQRATREEALTAIMDTAGDRALRLFNQVDSYLAVIQKRTSAYAPERVFPDEFDTSMNWYPAVKRFYDMINDENFTAERTENNKSLWIIGPSRVGKTVLARSLGIHWYMQSMWNSERLDESAQYGVMDDLTWDSIKFNYKAMLGMQRDVTVTDKYRKKSVYRGGLPVIVLTNILPDFTNDEMAWLQHNVVFIHVFDKLF